MKDTTITATTAWQRGGHAPDGQAADIGGSSHCAICGRKLPYGEKDIHRITLSRRSVHMAIPPMALSSPLRGGRNNTYVLFDDSEGDPPRQLTIVVHERTAATWEMQITAEPPLSGAVLISVGVQSFGGRFANDGTAAIRNIPAEVLTDGNAPDLEIALLPLMPSSGGAYQP